MSALGRRLLPWLPAFAYMAAIWILSSRAIHIPYLAHGFRDKIVHAILYGGLTLLLLRAVTRTWPMAPARGAAIAAGIASAWGYSDELHQAFVPGRSADLFDWVADSVGAIAAASLALGLHHLRAQRGRSAGTAARNR